MKSFLKKYVHKFYYAFSGLVHGIRYDRSITLQVLIGLVVLLVCIPLSLTLIEWVIVLAMILLVVAAEFINSTLEELCDAIFPDYDIRAKKIKDYAAAAVLLLSMLAAIVGLYVIGGNLW